MPDKKVCFSLIYVKYLHTNLLSYVFLFHKSRIAGKCFFYSPVKKWCINVCKVKDFTLQVRMCKGGHPFTLVLLSNASGGHIFKGTFDRHSSCKIIFYLHSM